MKFFLKRISALFKSAPQDSSQKLGMVSSRRAILKLIVNTKKNANVLGLYCPALGEGMLLVGIEDISLRDTEPVITLRPYDLNGILLQRNQISLSEIRSVCAFDAVYENPLLRRETVH
jgi:hypothetical protein